MSANKVLVVIDAGVADVSLAGDVDVLVIDLDGLDDDEIVAAKAKLTSEWREAFPVMARYLDSGLRR